MPADRRTSEGPTSYTPYPPPSPSSPPTFQTPAIPQRPPASSRGSKGSNKRKAASPPRSLADYADREASPSAAAATASVDQGSYKVARAISSCTRCRTRKQKCDGLLPRCSACERAKVECIGFDAISKTNISRNHLHTLEQEVIQLRAQVAALRSGQPDPGVMTFPLPSHPPATLNAFEASQRRESLSLAIDPALSSDIDPALRSSFSPSSSVHQRRHSEFSHGGDRSPSLSSAMNPKNHSLTRMVHDAALRTGHAINQTNANAAFNVSAPFGSHSDKGSVHSGHEGEYGHGSPDRFHAPQRSGSTGSRLSNMAPQRPASAQAPGSGKGKVRQFAIPPLPPQPAVERLVAAYVDFVGVTAPIVHIPTLGRQLTKIREGNDVEESDVFVVMMVLALSTMASARFVDPPDELRACSEAFHAEAMKHLDAVFDEGSYVGLQAILLLIWYSLLNPEKGSIWYLVGLATRTCVDMGYHNEHNAQIEQLDALEIDMRRRLFWVAYKMDRLLSQSLGRPPSIPDGFINVPLPSALHDVDIHSNHFGPPTGDACAYKANFIHTIKIRQLQSEILTNTYGTHGIDQVPTQEWFDDCYDRLKAWLAAAPDPRGTMSAEGYAISFHNSTLLLYRPSSGNPRPDRKALSAVLASSSYIIRIYRRMQLNNRISWLWMTSHFSFMAGLSFLYAFLNLHTMGGGEGVPTLEEAMLDVESCLSTLEYLSPRVPSAGACHDTMRTLSQAILEQLAAPSASRSATASAAATLRNLSRAAPVSSSRDDPLPNSDYLAPLPSVTLPYELSLLDNLFVNPMATHQKASDYTNGAKTRAVSAEVRSSMATLYNQHANPGVNTANLINIGPSSGFGNGIRPYSLAAQVRAGYTDCPTIEQSLAGVEGTRQGQLSSSVDYGLNGNGNNTGSGEMDTMGDLGILLGAMDGQEASEAAAQALQAQAQHGVQVDSAQNFDFFSFLDEGFGQDAGLDGMALWS